jgi:hypothetical protein
MFLKLQDRTKNIPDNPSSAPRIMDQSEKGRTTKASRAKQE